MTIKDIGKPAKIPIDAGALPKKGRHLMSRSNDAQPAASSHPKQRAHSYPIP
jgi:hypothetical protein